MLSHLSKVLLTCAQIFAHEPTSFFKEEIVEYNEPHLTSALYASRDPKEVLKEWLQDPEYVIQKLNEEKKLLRDISEKKISIDAEKGKNIFLNNEVSVLLLLDKLETLFFLILQYECYGESYCPQESE